LVQTVDFITPVVDDPFIYGQIAAANSLSDVFAMGAEVINALNLVGFDSCNQPYEILREILEGGLDKVKECGAVVVGGHTIETPEMYYGLSVTGLVHPKKFWKNNTPLAGDVLILTKPLGLGILTTAIKADLVNDSELKEAVGVMRQLNLYASRGLKDLRVNACTDITGFGLIGHGLEMAKNATLELESAKIPILKSAVNYANMGIIPAGSYANKEFSSKLCNSDEIIFYDAQTSGGLLISIDERDANEALLRLKDFGYEFATIIGEVKQKEELSIVFK